MGTTETLARFVVETSFRDIPEETVGLAKDFTLKFLAATLVGCVEPLGRKLTKYLKEAGGTPEAGVVGGGFRTNVENAALALGTFSHASELEDDCFPGAASTVTVLPAALPLAEKMKLSGKDVLEAFVLGYEVQGKLSVAADPRAGGELGICPLPYYGFLGAAAVAGKMLGLTVEQMTWALSIAASQSSGILAQTGWMSHMLESGIASRGGVLAALLAKDNVTGRPDIIENPRGLSGVLGPGGFDLEKATKDLGQPFHIHALWLKKYSCCYAIHRQLDSLALLMKEHKLSYDQIESVEVDVNTVEAALCNRPVVTTVEGALFSWQHVLGSYMLDGKIGMETFTVDKALDPKTREAGSKVKVTVHPEWEPRLLTGPAPVTVTLKDGRRLTKELLQPLGGPESRLSREEMLHIYRESARAVLSPAHIERTAELVVNLDKVNDISELMDILTFRHMV